VSEPFFPLNVLCTEKYLQGAIFDERKQIVGTDSQLRRVVELNEQPSPAYGSLHPAWIEFIRLCRQIQHGDIEQLKIQDGLPTLAETVRQKVRFTK
jgi:hypothetical protein